MRILVLTQFFPPETGAASDRTASIARGLVADGHAVTVITALPSFPTGRIASVPATPAVPGVTVRRVPTYASPRQRRIDRLANWTSAGAGMLAAIVADRLRGVRYDLLLVSFPPITQAVVALAAKAVLRVPLAVDVRDVLADRGVQIGVWKDGSLAHRVVDVLSDALYRNATLISTLNETCRARIVARGIGAERVHILANGFDAIEACAVSPYVRRPGEIVAAYVGTLGQSNGVEILLDAAARLRGPELVRIVIAGDGTERARLERRAREAALENVTFLGALGADEARALQRDAELCIIPLRAAVDDTIPKKMYDALALGTPVIAAIGGEGARFLRESGGGIVVPPEDGAALADAIRRLAADPDARRRHGAAGAAFVRPRYARSALVRDYVVRLRRCAS